jgi:hypothetical protein
LGIRLGAEKDADLDGWAVYEMDASHVTHVAELEALMEILDKVAKAT